MNEFADWNLYSLHFIKQKQKHYNVGIIVCCQLIEAKRAEIIRERDSIILYFKDINISWSPVTNH